MEVFRSQSPRSSCFSLNIWKDYAYFCFMAIFITDIYFIFSNNFTYCYQQASDNITIKSEHVLITYQNTIIAENYSNIYHKKAHISTTFLWILLLHYSCRVMLEVLVMIRKSAIIVSKVNIQFDDHGKLWFLLICEKISIFVTLEVVIFFIFFI